jgi:hypothetical protein
MFYHDGGVLFSTLWRHWSYRLQFQRELMGVTENTFLVKREC